MHKYSNVKPDDYFMCPYCDGCGMVNYRNGVNALYTCQDCYAGFAIGTPPIDFEGMIYDHCYPPTVSVCAECKSEKEREY